MNSSGPAASPADEPSKDGLYRILSLDGGGAKGFYTLGVLREIEALLNCPLYKRFDLVFGTSTGAIIAALIALGYEVDAIHTLYRDHVPAVTRARGPDAKSKALAKLGTEVFGNTKFDAVKTGIGIVATRWVIEKPMIFKGTVAQAHGRTGTFNLLTGGVTSVAETTSFQTDNSNPGPTVGLGTILNTATFTLSNMTQTTITDAITGPGPYSLTEEYIINAKGVGTANLTIDLLSQVPVPEPASMALLGVGLLGLGFIAKKRRQ